MTCRIHKCIYLGIKYRLYRLHRLTPKLKNGWVSGRAIKLPSCSHYNTYLHGSVLVYCVSAHLHSTSAHLSLSLSLCFLSLTLCVLVCGNCPYMSACFINCVRVHVFGWDYCTVDGRSKIKCYWARVSCDCKRLQIGDVT